VKVRGVLSIAFLLLPLAGCGTREPRPEIQRDRYGLGSQTDVYVIQQAPRRGFLIERRGDVAGGVVAGGILAGGVGMAAGATAGVMARQYESARLQQKLDLGDPAQYMKEGLAEAVRQELALTNMQVFPDAANLPVFSVSRSDTAEDAGNRRTYQRPPGGAPEPVSIATSMSGTFNEKYKSGAVIEVVTDHWGLDDYRVKYTGTVRLVTLADSKTLMAARCRWIVLDPVDHHKLFFEAGAHGVNAYVQTRLYMERAEGLLYANDGALLKATLRNAAEQCLESIIPRFFGPKRAGKRE
jgi:hypothetical protein